MFTVDPAFDVLDSIWLLMLPFAGGDAGFVAVRDIESGAPLDAAWESSVFAQRKFVLTITVTSS